MSLFPFVTNSRRLTSHSIVEFTVSRSSGTETHIDRVAAMGLNREIEAISPRPLSVQAMYLSFESFCKTFTGYQWTDQSIIDRLTSSFLEPVKTNSGKQLYRIMRHNLLNLIERDEIRWIVSYEPFESYDRYLQTVDELQREYLKPLQAYMSQDNGVIDNHHMPFNSFSPMTQAVIHEASSFIVPTTSTSLTSFKTPSAFTPQAMTTPSASMQCDVVGTVASNGQNSFPIRTLPVQASMQEACIPDERSADLSTPAPKQGVMKSMSVQSGYPSPATVVASPSPAEERGPIQGLLDEMITEMPTPRGNSPRQRSAFPISQFAQVEMESKEDDKAASAIVALLKVLAIDPSPQTKHRVSLAGEKAAIKRMSIESSLNIGNQERPLSEKIHCLFDRYYKTDVDGQESLQRALLIVAIRLMRQKFVNESGKKGPGNYAGDFDALYSFSSRFIPHGANLCRMIVSCGHPCILIVLVRMAIRNRMCIGKLLDTLPLQPFCRFIATGKVTDCNNTSNKTTIHDNLQWLHTNVFLPLLYASSRRMPQASLCMVDGSLDCDEETCLRAIVHHTQQIKYGNYLMGHFHDEEWKRGRVLLETRSYDKNSKAEYSIEKKKRTFHYYTLDSYSESEKLESPPEFLVTRVLSIEVD